MKDESPPGITPPSLRSGQGPKRLSAQGRGGTRGRGPVTEEVPSGSSHVATGGPATSTTPTIDVPTGATHPQPPESDHGTLSVQAGRGEPRTRVSGPRTDGRRTRRQIGNVRVSRAAATVS